MDLDLATEDEVTEIWYRFLNLDCIPEGKFLKISAKELEKGCQCRICHGLVLDPIACLCEEQAHLIGKSCAKRKFSQKESIQKYCPNFQSLNIFYENDFCKDELNKIAISCPFCDFAGSVFRVRAHVLEECALDGKVVACPFPECKELVQRRDLRAHLLKQKEKHHDFLKSYGLDDYLKVYVDALVNKYDDLTKNEVKGI